MCWASKCSLESILVKTLSWDRERKKDRCLPNVIWRTKNPILLKCVWKCTFMLSLFALNMSFGLNCICFSGCKARGSLGSLHNLIANQEGCLLRKACLFGLEVMTDVQIKAVCLLNIFWFLCPDFTFLFCKMPRCMS